MKQLFASIWKYLVIFFAGAITALVWAMKQVKPNQPAINADTYIANQQQNIGKLKQRGEGNMQDMAQLPQTPRERRKERRARRREERSKSQTEKPL